MPIVVSPNLTNPKCQQRAGQLKGKWKAILSKHGVQGYFRLAHGADAPCAKVHNRPFNRGFYIVAIRGAHAASGVAGEARDCKVFVTKAGKPSHYVGAGRDASALRRVPFKCTCGGGH